MNIIVATHPIERKTITGLFVVLLVLVLMYAYFIASIVFNVAARKNNEQQFLIQNTQVGELESRYLAKRDSVLQEKERFVLEDVKIKRYLYLSADRKLTLYDESGF